MNGSGGPAAAAPLRLETQDIEDLELLHEELRGVPGIRVGAVSSVPEPGEQGATIDFLTVALSAGGGLTALINLLRAIIESRGPAFRLTMRRGKEKVELTADNLDEALPLVRELMNGS